MRLRLLRADEQMLLTHLTVAARGMYIYCISVLGQRKAILCFYSLRLCRREFVLLKVYLTSLILAKHSQSRAKSTKPRARHFITSRTYSP